MNRADFMVILLQIGNVAQQDAQTDIDDAIAMGYLFSTWHGMLICANWLFDSLDAFALNIGDPTASYVAPALSYLFPYAKSKGFKLFLSMDLSAKGGGSVSFP